MLRNFLLVIPSMASKYLFLSSNCAAAAYTVKGSFRHTQCFASYGGFWAAHHAGTSANLENTNNIPKENPEEWPKESPS